MAVCWWRGVRARAREQGWKEKQEELAAQWARCVAGCVCACARLTLPGARSELASAKADAAREHLAANAAKVVLAALTAVNDAAGIARARVQAVGAEIIAEAESRVVAVRWRSCGSVLREVVRARVPQTTATAAEEARKLRDLHDGELAALLEKSTVRADADMNFRMAGHWRFGMRPPPARGVILPVAAVAAACHSSAARAGAQAAARAATARIDERAARRRAELRRAQESEAHVRPVPGEGGCGV